MHTQSVIKAIAFLFPMRLCKRILIIKLSGGLGNQLYQFSNALQLKGGSKNTALIFIHLDSRQKHEYPRLRELGFNVLIVTGRLGRIIERLLYSLTLRTSSVFSLWDQLAVHKRQSLITYVTGTYQFAPPERVRRLIRRKVRIGNSGMAQPAIPRVHIRLGDYKSPWASRQLGNLDPSYYHHALRQICACKSNPVHVCSDGSHDEVKPYLPGLEFKLYVGRTDLDDMRYLAGSEYLICGNSTFALWSAYLSSAKVVYVPKTFFICESLFPEKTANRYLSHWIALDNEFLP